MHLKFKHFWWFSECTYPKHMDRKRLSQHASIKLSSCSHKFTLKHAYVSKTVGYVCEGKQLGNKLYVYFRSVWQQQYTVNKSTALVSSEAGTLNSVLCFCAPNAEQLACFAQTFTNALELVHRCLLRNHNDGAAGGNLEIKGR